MKESHTQTGMARGWANDDGVFSSLLWWWLPSEHKGAIEIPSNAWAKSADYTMKPV